MADFYVSLERAISQLAKPKDVAAAPLPRSNPDSHEYVKNEQVFSSSSMGACYHRRCRRYQLCYWNVKQRQ